MTNLAELDVTELFRGMSGVLLWGEFLEFLA
jgi:hypothetical protein